ncbi:MAG: glycosyltransferase, partial [Desulfococcaceae bacterium]|nr:glycosyltransferase [Desulfococcaceae bacterium]
PGISEQISDGENGRLIPPKDSAALSKAIIEMLNDSKTAGKMGKAARKRAEEEFSVNIMISKTAQIYNFLSGTHR